ncbi:MAG: MMPL family transporter [Treponema sp.]|nr:MMPL family transporter [Treponema sp.]
MKIAKINECFKRFGELLVTYRWIWMFTMLAITIFCCAGLSKLKLVNDEESWFDNWEQVKKNQDHFEDIFGSTDSVMAHITADNVFDPEVLDMIKRLGDALLENVPYASSVTSLMDLEIPIGTEDGFEVANPFEDGIPSDPIELQKKKNFILSRESLVNNLVSDDAKETWLILNLEHYSETLEEAMNLITPPAMEVFNRPEFVSDAYIIRPAGFSYTEFEENKATEEQMVSRIAIGFCVMVICLIIFIRSLRGVIVPAIATVGAICSTLGASAWMGIEGNPSMLILTALLSMALAVGYAVHYINSFKLHFRQTGNRRQSIILGVQDSGWALLFTVITTMGGMLSFMAGGLRPMRWVGGITAAAVFMVFAYTMILLPCLLSFGKNRTPNPQFISSEGSTNADFVIERIGKAVLNTRWVTIMISVFIILVSVPALFKIQVNMNYSEMMGEKTPYIHRLMDICRSKLGSQYSYEVLVEYPEADAFKDPEKLKKLDILAERIGTLSMTKISGSKPRVSSVTKIVKEMNRVFNEDKPEEYRIPDDQAIISEDMFIYESSGGNDLYQYIDDSFSTTYLHVELSDYDADQCTQNMNQVEIWVKELFPDAETAGVVGEVMQYAVMNGKLVRGSIKSIGTSFVIIYVLLCLAFFSIHTGFIAMIPNIAPVFLIGAVMGWGHISLDMITAMCMPMILGIAVDDTIHFTNHIKFHFERTGSYRQSILNSYREIGKSMIMTTIILCAMFFIFCFSTMNALVRIGYLSIIGLASALVADYTLTPVLMYLTKPFGPEKNTKEI